MTSPDTRVTAAAPPALARAYVPYVTTRLELVWLPDAPADLAAFWFGPATTYRLTPSVYAHLFHAAEKRAARPGIAPEAVSAMIGALERIYVALVTRYDPAEVHPFGPATPPLPEAPRLPRFDAEKADAEKADAERGERTEAKGFDPRYSPAPKPPAKTANKKRAGPTRTKATRGDAIATGNGPAGMFEGL